MKHAGPQALAALADLLEQIRRFGDLRERTTGVFYRKSSAFLHFHEDPAGLFADLKTGDDFERFRVSTRAEQRSLLRHIAQLTRAER